MFSAPFVVIEKGQLFTVPVNGNELSEATCPSLIFQL